MSPGRPCPSPRAQSAVNATRRNECGSAGAGGTFTYFLRPDQKMTVAMNIRMPGIPNATAGPYLRRKMGMSSEAKNEPKLMVQ
jgi:hypothetical protein